MGGPLCPQVQALPQGEGFRGRPLLRGGSAFAVGLKSNSLPVEIQPLCGLRRPFRVMDAVPPIDSSSAALAAASPLRRTTTIARYKADTIGTRPVTIGQNGV
jgi:hypothetical protein